MYDITLKKIEHYLYYYNLMDYKISLLKEEHEDCNYKQTYKIWIKNQSNSLENEAIRNISVEQRIYKLKKWQMLISQILNKYKLENKEKYKFICYKYFKKLNHYQIQSRMHLNKHEQEELKLEILNYILFVAIKKNMLKEVEV